MSLESKKVLLVDDDPAAAMIISATLTNAGMSVKTMRGGAEAVFDLLWGRYDLIVTDLLMPRVDGWEVIRQARASQKSAKVIAVSGGMTDRIDSGRALEVAEMVGADVTLTKPINPNQLVRVVEALFKN
jgi:DNA-binding response OmpR family regulator